MGGFPSWHIGDWAGSLTLKSMNILSAKANALLKLKSSFLLHVPSAGYDTYNEMHWISLI